MEFEVQGVRGTLEEAGPLLVIILHGVGGHRDYCYQKQLALALRGIGISSARIDFRGCGESTPIDGRAVGGSDFEDLDAVYRFFTHKYFVLAIVGHSRGASCMFLWALRTQAYVPFLINCSGRYHTWQYRERVYAEQAHYQRDGGYALVARRYGQYTPQWISMREVDEFCSWDSCAYAGIDPRIQVLTVFGDRDHHVPFSDAGSWASLFDSRHTLKVVMGADHNFYGRDGKGNVLKINNKKVNYNPQVVEIITNHLKSPGIPRYAIAGRWYAIDGVENFRDFSCWPLQPGQLFRSAHLGNITVTGIQQLHQLGIKYILDLRSDSERADFTAIDGIETVHVPPFKSRQMDPEALIKRWEDPVRVNADILANAGPAIEALESLATRGGGVLVHCTAGKDRTGVVCAAYLVKHGVPAYVAAREYELTTIGWAKHRATLRVALESYPAESVDKLLGSPYDRMLETLAKL